MVAVAMVAAVTITTVPVAVHNQKERDNISLLSFNFLFNLFNTNSYYDN
jgi:hypothetical protein